MKSILIGSIALILFSSLFIGCSGNSPATPSARENILPDISQSYLAPQNRTILGLWEVNIDASSGECEITPARFGEVHLNIRKFLEEGVCTNCFKIEPPIVVQPYGFDVNLSITHPYPGMSIFTVFDMRGIIMLPGTYSFPSSDILTTRVSNGDWSILNPDGWTPIFNAVDYPGPGVKGYSRGRYVDPDWGDPTNTLNPFMAYYSEGQSEDEGGRRAFFNYDKVVRTYKFSTGVDQLKFWYAIDACWDIPSGSDPYELSDFPMSANCVEPYRFDFEIVNGVLWDNGGTVTIGVDIYDHQGWNEPWSLMWEAPECFDGAAATIMPPESITGDAAHWEISVTNFKGGLDKLAGTELLVTYGNTEPDPLVGTIYGYGRFTIPVGDEPQIPPPIVESIAPNVVEQDSVIDDALITGQIFMAYPTVHLEQAGQPDIYATDVNGITSLELTADFDLTGAALGFWDVVVTNPDMQFGKLIKGLEIIEPSSCNSVIHTNYLGIGDFSGGTHMPAYDACFVHDTGTEADGEFMGYISGFAGTVCLTYIIDTLTPETGHGLQGANWGNPQIGKWPVPVSIDISEEAGRFFIVWNTNYSIVEVWSASTGKFDGETDAAGGGQVFSLDTDGHGGFWCGYFPEAGFAPGIKHFLPDGAGETGTLVEDMPNHIMLGEVWGTPIELIVIPDNRLLVLTSSNNGKVASYDLSTTPPTFVGEISDLFTGKILDASYPERSIDMVADFSDPDLAHCRILIFADIVDAGTQLVKIDSDLNILAGPVLLPTNHYYSIDMNPHTGDIALWPNVKDGPGEYALIEQPAGW
ncbi:MAG: hypothetical protein NTY09_10035 [bacterium]|nr:hypothetical protein [bacterium]